MRMDGKRVLVTAAAQGIGRACAEMFVSAGAVVHATDRNAAGLANLVEKGIIVSALDGTADTAVEHMKYQRP